MSLGEGYECIHGAFQCSTPWLREDPIVQVLSSSCRPCGDVAVLKLVSAAQEAVLELLPVM